MNRILFLSGGKGGSLALTVGVHVGVLSLLVSAQACGQQPSMAVNELPAPFNALAGVELGDSFRAVALLRPSARGNPESGFREVVDEYQVFYDFGGSFFPGGVFTPGSLRLVLATRPAVEGDTLSGGSLADVFGYGAPDFCASARDGSDLPRPVLHVWQRAPWLLSVAYYPATVEKHRSGETQVPARVTLRWEREAESPMETVRTPCKTMDR